MPRHIPATTTITLEPHQVLVKPLVTEKGMHKSTRNNAYAFEVSRLATKDDVKRAVESLFEVKVLKVHTQNRRGKARRTKFRQGTTRDWKKAIVTLDPEHKINFF
jgi:large subunit ribosomal protein L23